MLILSLLTLAHLFALFLTVGGIATAYYLYSTGSMGSPLLMLACILLGILLGIHFAMKAHSFTEIIHRYVNEDEQYSYNNSGLITPTKAPWKCIKGFSFAKFCGIEYIAVDMKDNDCYAKNANPLNQHRMRVNIKKTGFPILLPAYSKLFTKEEIMENLKFLLQKYSK